MGLFDDAVPGGNVAKPIMIALGALLVGRLLGGGSDRSDEAARQGEAVPDGRAGSSAAGPAGGGLAGGLGGLLERLANAGHGEAVDSWVKPGDNKPIAPDNLETALGSTTVSDLARQAGVSERELLEQLSKVLPGVIDKLTPEGRVPDQQRVATLLRG